MTGTHTQNPVFSRITLALMEDTGWYRADYANAKPLAWGKGLGCEFATKSCKEWINNNTFRYAIKLHSHRLNFYIHSYMIL